MQHPRIDGIAAKLTKEEMSSEKTISIKEKKMKQLLTAVLVMTCLNTPAAADSSQSGHQGRAIEKHAIQHAEQPRVIEKHAIEQVSPYAGENISNTEGWLTSERYEISYIDGYQEIYNPDDAIIFYVEGKSERMNVEQPSGFLVNAYIYDNHRNILKTADVKYDSSKQAWRVKFDAPKDYNKYDIGVALFCSKIESPCAATYGAGTTVRKNLPLQVR